MDANNVEWYVEDKGGGYPAGDFGDALFGGLVESTPLQRLRALADMYSLADSNNQALLNSVLPPGTKAVVEDYYHRNDKMEALEKLHYTLAVLPMLLVLGFPQLQVAIREYANRDPKGDQNGPV